MMLQFREETWVAEILITEITVDSIIRDELHDLINDSVWLLSARRADIPTTIQLKTTSRVP